MRVSSIFVLWICLWQSACGVKGNPEPPDTPPRLGRGQPTYHRATQDLAFPDIPPPAAEPADDDDKDD